MLYQANYIGEERETVVPPKVVKKDRLTWVDHARGIAIMLVVYRHDVIGMKRSGIDVSPLMYNLQEVFYNFRMPVFFVLSGLFMTGSLQKRSRGAIVKDRAYTILYPYLLWGTIMILMQTLFSSYTNGKRNWTDLFDIIIQPRKVDHLWYLLALFNTSVLYLGLSKVIRNPYLHGALAIAMNLVSVTSLFEGNSFVADLLYFYCYFFAGTLLSGVLLDREKRESFLRISRLFWVLPLFIAGQWFWFAIREQEKTYTLPLLFVNLVACYFIYIISFRISNSRNSGWLAYLGKHSLYIYILHVFVMAFIRALLVHMHFHLNPWAELALCWVCGLLVPVLLFQLLKGFGFERLFSLKQKNSV
ncbi:MAG TPA: acyltransferase [Puia sp.]|nr:acyltransferase [Puia sp.]